MKVLEKEAKKQQHKAELFEWMKDEQVKEVKRLEKNLQELEWNLSVACSFGDL